MSSLNLDSTHLQSMAERGLSSFLRAFAGNTPNEDLQVATDCWIRAVETTGCSPGETAERFIRRVTIQALAINAGQVQSKMPAASSI
jgi:hypothetical protein